MTHVLFVHKRIIIITSEVTTTLQPFFLRLWLHILTVITDNIEWLVIKGKIIIFLHLSALWANGI